ncbi:Primary amine oxidase [Thalictrum thalictroides]|uniref:Amine oxidase n=1 Tax=Thalictrum thalictroides TaxID=46969 RepID=A0A7J6W811_THATH|nr:Primary amine oxidase [Thalictrum thalictroides]
MFLFLLCLSFTSAHKHNNNHHYHPLDPLTPKEFIQIQTIIKQSQPDPNHNLTFQYVGLDDPDKHTVLSWHSSNQTTQLPPRRAFVITRINKQTHETIVDLSTNSVLSSRVYTGYGYPLFTFAEQIAASLLPLKYAPFLKSISKRKLKLEEVVCSTYSVGWFGEESKKDNKRELKILCFYLDGTVNLYVRPIEGITVVVDLDEMKITKYYDRFVVPVPKVDGLEYQSSKQKPPFGPSVHGVTVAQPDGPGFMIDGHTIRILDKN